ncbi:MAG: type IV pilus modification protein PilV [Ottowia sp.]|uniref:type IV pilus modification protein PilV n=1 Tax=Ottowia sp. TaxID=1898956 RepID=UPI003C735452
MKNFFVLRRRRQAGTTLIEILVTLVILLFGLLGLVGVSGRANQAELESFQRVQALQLLENMVNRLNANRKVASCYSNGTAGLTLDKDSEDTDIPDCTLGTDAMAQARAQLDLKDWSKLIKGESVGVAKVGAPIDAMGCITQTTALVGTKTTYVYRIAVAWQGLTPTAAPTLSDGTAFPCGDGVFGNEKLHRVVTVKVQIGNIS